MRRRACKPWIRNCAILASTLRQTWRLSSLGRRRNLLPSSMTSNSILLRERLSSLSSRTSSADRTVTGAEGRRSLLQEQAASVLERKESAESLQETLTLALAVLQELEQAWRRSFEQRLSSVGSEGLSAVFGADIKMRVVSKTFRDATSLKLMLIEDGIEIDEPADGTGGRAVPGAE